MTFSKTKSLTAKECALLSTLHKIYMRNTHKHITCNTCIASGLIPKVNLTAWLSAPSDKRIRTWISSSPTVWRLWQDEGKKHRRGNLASARFEAPLQSAWSVVSNTTLLPETEKDLANHLQENKHKKGSWGNRNPPGYKIVMVVPIGTVHVCTCIVFKFTLDLRC